MPKQIKTKTVPATTNNITEGIVNTMLSEGWSASRINTTGVWDPVYKCFRRTGGRKGFSDVICCIAGRYVSIEVKRGKDRTSPDQISYADEVIRAGGVYIIAHTWEQFKIWWACYKIQNNL